MTRPRLQIYVICFSFRSGSHLMCDLLGATGVLGKPAEYLNPNAQQDWRRHLGLAEDASDPEYWDALQERAGAGWFGVKAERNLEPFVDHFGRSSLAYIQLTREDVLAQAISWYRAFVSGRWSQKVVDETGQDLEVAVPFDREAILERLERIRATNRWWDQWFTDNEITPLIVTYEELCHAPAQTVERVAEFLGESVPEHYQAESKFRIQRDATSADWHQRLQSVVTPIDG